MIQISETKPLSVLLVEDQEDEAMLISRMLNHATRYSFVVEHACSLSEAIRLLSNCDYDACVLDLGLPDGIGIDSLHRIRSVDARLPVVVLTGNDDETLGLSAIETGAQDFVAKDAITGQFLSRAIRFAIARQEKVLGYAADANTDVLTGMPNRRSLSAVFSEMLDTCDRLCISIIDVDHFKQINDSHGHLVGDQVLQQLAQLIRAVTDERIQAARLGGEEFTLLIPEAQLDEGFQMVERLLSEISGSPFCIGADKLNVTASAGIATVSSNESLDDVLSRTDVALYEAKRSGRNRVCAKH